MLSNRLSCITPSYTIGISAKVNDLKSKGNNIIDLSIGEPDFFVPKRAKTYGINSLESNLSKYDMVPGLKVLRDEICNKLSIENKCSFSPDEIVVSSGAKHAITNTLLALTNPGDEVLVPKPYWVSYPEMVKLVNAIPIFIDTDKSNDFKLTKDILKQYITPKTKMLFLNNPSNPTGAVYTKEELLDIASMCLENNIYILADEIYERINYNNNFTSISSLGEDIKNISIIVNGFSKSAAMTGLRIGYTASNKEIAKAISTIQGHLVSHPSLTSQYIAYGALKECSDDMSDMVKVYKHRRNLVVEKLNKIKDLGYVTPDGAFYIFIDLSLYKTKLDFKDSFSIEICNQLLDKYEVAAVPGIAFGLDDYIRISYACNEHNFLTGIDRLNDFLLTLS
ncbi:MAG: pyridoxal phosphate-dependent aminotransferase [Paraclostridium sp.]